MLATTPSLCLNTSVDVNEHSFQASLQTHRMDAVSPPFQTEPETENVRVTHGPSVHPYG
jgi:hypothetical protein